MRRTSPLRESRNHSHFRWLRGTANTRTLRSDAGVSCNQAPKRLSDWSPPPATGAVTHAHSSSLPSRTAGPFSALLSFCCLLSSSWSTRQECPEHDETYREWRVGLPITETELRTLKEGFYCQDEVRTAKPSLLLNLMASAELEWVVHYLRISLRFQATFCGYKPFVLYLRVGPNTTCLTVCLTVYLVSFS